MSECLNRDPCVWFVVSVVEILVCRCLFHRFFLAISINVAGYIVFALVLSFWVKLKECATFDLYKGFHLM